VLWWTSGDHVERSGAWSPLGASGGMKIVLDRLIAPFQGSWSLDFMGVQRSIHGHASVVSKKVCWSLMLVAQNSSWSLDRLLKRTLIAWFHFDPGRKRFYRGHLCDYPLNVGTCPDVSSPCKGSSSETNQSLCFCTTHTRQFLFET